MRFYLAPLEGVTGYIFRNALDAYFPGTDRYFTPFIVPDQKHALRKKELRDILPENNRVKELVPQILTSDPVRFVETAKVLAEYGYAEVNLNLGCPSGTVVAGGRGAGMLADLDGLNRFLEQIFDASPLRISVKTRIGMEHPEEGYALMDIYNQYPMSEVIIHPRTRKEYYKGEPHLDVFGELLAMSKHPVCYNGNLFTVRDYEQFRARFPQVERVMLGRGVLADPGLVRRLKSLEHAQRIEEMGLGNNNIALDVQSKNIGWTESTNGCDSAIETVKTECCSEQNAAEQKDGCSNQIEFRQNKDEIRRMRSEIYRTNKQELRAFHDTIFQQYREIFDEDKNAIFHMKELWSYLVHSFVGSESYAKKIRKTASLNEYRCEVGNLFRACDLYPDGPVQWRP